MFRLPNFKLSGVNADRNSAGAGRMIITGERTLTAHVEPASRRERERMSRDNQAGLEPGHDPSGRKRIGRHQNLPLRTSKWVGLPRLLPPFLTQCAVQRSIVSMEVGGWPSRARICDAFPSSAFWLS